MHEKLLKLINLTEQLNVLEADLQEKALLPEMLLEQLINMMYVVDIDTKEVIHIPKSVSMTLKHTPKKTSMPDLNSV